MKNLWSRRTNRYENLVIHSAPLISIIIITTTTIRVFGPRAGLSLQTQAPAAIMPKRMSSTANSRMGGSPGDVSENPVMYEKRKKGWRMSGDVGQAMEGLENESSFSKLSVTSPTSQLILILQAFRHFTYVTAHSPTLLSLLLRHRIFTYVTWRAAHA